MGNIEINELLSLGIGEVCLQLNPTLFPKLLISWVHKALHVFQRNGTVAMCMQSTAGKASNKDWLAAQIALSWLCRKNTTESVRYMRFRIRNRTISLSTVCP